MMLSLVNGTLRSGTHVGFSLLIAASVVCKLAPSVHAGGQLPDITLGKLQIEVEFVGDFPGNPKGATGLGHAGDGSGRLFFS